MKASGIIAFVLILAFPLAAEETSAPSSQEAFQRTAAELRERALSAVESQVKIPVADRPQKVSERYPWKVGIVTVLFHIGERPGGSASAWDPRWAENYGGFDDPNPQARRGFAPASFVPRLNTFYCALPYNDLAGDHFKPEAKQVIPWFAQAFEQDGRSICRDRWLAIRKGSRVCYAQWSDVGPHGSDHWEYVFGSARPKPNANHGTGLAVSPAVRDYLALESTDVTDWKFVEVRDVPAWGPWMRFGDNNKVREKATPPAARKSLRIDSGPAAVTN